MPLQNNVFPQDGCNEIYILILMVTDAIFRGNGKEGQARKHYNMAPFILHDIYWSLGLCYIGFLFFQGCNILLSEVDVTTID